MALSMFYDMKMTYDLRNKNGNIKKKENRQILEENEMRLLSKRRIKTKIDRRSSQ